MMISQADLHRAETVLELGPGTGIVTEIILENLAQDARFMALEINPAFASEQDHPLLLFGEWRLRQEYRMPNHK